MRHVIGGAVITWAATRQNSMTDLLAGVVLFLAFAVGEYVAVWYAPKSWEMVGEKNDSLSEWASVKTGFNVFVKEIDSSFQNAFAWKDWNTVQIVFTKAIREKTTADELKAIIGHEIGHIQKKHPGRLMLNSAILDLSGILGGWAFVSWWVKNMPSFNPEKIDHTFWIWITPWAILALVFIASREWIYYLRRKYEFEADIVASEYTDAKTMINALKAIHPFQENEITDTIKLRETHPSLKKRLYVLSKMISA